MLMSTQTMKRISFISFVLLNNWSCILGLNKCNINNGGCWGTCYNDNNGSYHCSCPDGFVIGADGHICIDIDECFMKAHNCSQRCCNTVGGYRCMCYEGFELVDGICKDIDECSPRTRPCSHECFNYPGSYQCTCRSGYILQEDKTTCQDINECDVYNGGCSDVCTNTLGSYKCSCYEGYSLLGDEHMCGQINACIHASCKDGECLTTGHGYLCNCSLPHFAGRFCHEVVISTEVSHRSSTSILISSTLLTWLISWS